MNPDQMRIQEILTNLLNQRIDITNQDISLINKICMEFLNDQNSDLSTVKNILMISNILYNNTSREILPLEDGVYDLVVAKYNRMTNNQSPVGAPPVELKTESNVNLDSSKLDQQLVTPFHIIDNDMMYYDNFVANNVRPEDYEIHDDTTLIDNIVRNSAHSYPELVGTLHKCKFVLNRDAELAGADKSDSVMIFERDFLYPTYQTAYQFAYQKNQSVSMIAELKYDGVSIEMEVAGDSVISAISRGDTANDEASDLTPIFEGYKFVRAKDIDPSAKFGIKFEAIITFDNLARMEQMFGKKYKNARVAIIGILGSKDARRYRDLITLVPIRTAGLNIHDPVQEVEFLNKYYSNGVLMKYAVLRGDYVSLLFQVNKFKNEAQFMRPYLNFMYDGIVLSYTDPDLKEILGRVNSIDNWSMAVKFDALEKNTYFYGYKYTVGQNGLITPMAYFAPVEFNGSIHDKTTVHSYKRFKKLALKEGDIVTIKYVNDVICYLSKPEISYNIENPNPEIEFPLTCPVCGSHLMTSDTEDNAYCPNQNCDGRRIARVSNMLKKLNIKDFGRSYLEKLNITDLRSFMNLDRSLCNSIIGTVMTDKLFERIEELKSKPYPDYRLVGSLGFSSISIETWRSILKVVQLEDIISMPKSKLKDRLTIIKGISNARAKVISDERSFFINDLKLIASMSNVERSYCLDYNPVDNRTQVRFTGFRSKDLENAFNSLGYDADGEKGVTKKTKILVIPYQGFTSNKLSKISPDCIVLDESQAWSFINSMTPKQSYS